MAEKDEESLIGYDPLAWMHQTDFKQVHQSDDIPNLESGSAPEFSDLSPKVVMISETEQRQSLPGNFVDDGNESGVLALAPVLNIQNVTALHQQLAHMLANFNLIEIDASAVTMIDTSTLQLLLILKQTAIGLQKSISIDFPSDKFIEAAELLGIAEMLEVDQAASGLF
jgi:ABC-type transporter Mla MlaB component